MKFDIPNKYQKDYWPNLKILFEVWEGGRELPDTESAGGKEGSPGAPLILWRNEREIQMRSNF